MTRLISCAFALGLLAVAACGSDTLKPGDECDPDSGCPDDLVCAAEGDTTTCQIPPGSECDPQEDHCLPDAVCSAGTCLIPAGGSCDPAASDYCLDDYVCGQTLDGDGICGIGAGGECDPADPLCAGSLVCAEMDAGGNECWQPVFLEGNVFDSATLDGIAGAHVVAIDDQSTAITDIAVTDDAGDYQLEIPIARDADGAPISEAFTMRGSASGYQTFPGGLRTALPLSTSEAVEQELAWYIETALTDIALIALPPEQQGLPSISGAVLADDESAGVLVVAEDGAGNGVSAVTGLDGGYTIFNVPAGSYTVHGYAAGLQLEPASAEVVDADLTGVDLSTSSAGLGSISGTINIVNAPGGSASSVVLVVASTFDDTFVRGEVPRGLRTPLVGPPDVTSSFTIADVPAGSYVVLAAFENDDLVRDPDPNIAGTQIVTVDMPSPGQDVTLATSFKVTEALPVVGPGVDAPEQVSAAPTLEWGDDSSEDFYTVDVYNAYGELVWCLSDLVSCDGGSLPAVSGPPTASVVYGGPLEPGMYYQFRATSWRSPGGNPGPIATTEDLRGVFFLPAGP